MIYRICDGADNRSDSGENDIYRKFKYQFDCLFDAGEVANSDKEFNEMYVSDPDFENSLISFISSHSSKATFCVGYTGIGKTTSIRYCLQLGVSNVTKLNAKSYTNINKNMIVFPTFLDGMMDYELFDLPRRISAVCTSLEEKHPDLLRKIRTLEGMIDFYKFIRNHSPHIVETLDEWELYALSDKQQITQKLEYAKKTNPVAYFASKLKYYIFQKCDIYDRLIILLDDIESLPKKLQEDLIVQYLRLFTCMKNTEYPSEKGVDYRVILLISVRPHTYRILHEGYSARVQEAFPASESLLLKKSPVSLDKLFERRFLHYTSISPNVIGNKKTWDDCYRELIKLNKSFEGKYKEMILKLCFLNLRSSLACYSRVFSNRFWIQDNQPRKDYFTVNSNEYSFNNITVIRAISCGNKPLYTGSYVYDDVSDIIIPNIFMTSRDVDYSFHCLLVMKYFYRKCGNMASAIYTDYGEKSEELQSVYSEWNRALNSDQVNSLKKAIIYLFECRVLRKSILDKEDYLLLDSPKSIQDSSRLYLSPRGTELFDMLTRDSVYLELLREAAWRNDEGRENSFSSLGSYALMKKGYQNKIFLDLLEYIDALREAEEDFFIMSQIHLSEYRAIFGSELVVERLLSGLIKSLNYSGYMNNSEINNKYHRIYSRIQESRDNLMR